MLVSLASCGDEVSSTIESSTPDSTSSSSLPESSSEETSSSSEEDSSSTSIEEESDPEPEVTYSNYRRNGELVVISDSGLTDPIYYGSEVEYSFIGGNDGSKGSAYEFDMLPGSPVTFTYDDTEYGTAYQNITSIDALYSAPATLNMFMTLFGIDMSIDYPHFFDSACLDYSANATAENVPDDTLSLSYIDGMLSFAHTNNGYIQNTSSEGTEDESSSGDSEILRGFAESYLGELPSIDIDAQLDSIIDLLAEIDFSQLDAADIEIDLVSLFKSFDTLLPEGTDWETISSTLGIIGGVLYVLGGGLDITVDSSILSNSVDVTLSLNELGIERAGTMINTLIGDLDGISIGLGDAAIGFTLYNTFDKSNLISDLWIKGTINIGAMGLEFPIGIDLDLGFCEIEQFSNQLASLDFDFTLNGISLLYASLSLDDQISELPSDFFSDISSGLETYRTISDEAEAYWSQIKGWVSSTNYYADPSVIDITSAGGEYIHGVANEYENLSDEAKIIIGAEINADSIVAGYDEGVSYLASVITRYQAFVTDGELLPSEIKTMFTAGFNYSTYTMNYITDYVNFEEAIAEQEGGEECVNAIHSTFDTYVSKIETALETAEAYTGSRTDDNLAAYIAAAQNISSDEISSLDTVIYGEYEERYDAVKDTYSDAINTAAEAYLRYEIKNKITSSASYDTIVSLVCNETFEAVRSIYGDSNTVSYMATNIFGTASGTTYVNRIKSKCQEEADAIFEEVCGYFKSATTLTEFNTLLSENSIEEDIATLDKVELYTLGTTNYSAGSTSLIAYARKTLTDPAE